MIQGHDIVCFANDWDSDPLSKKHIMTRLARDNRVLWIDSLGMRNPQPSTRDLSRAWTKLRRSFGGLRQVDDNIHVYAPLVIPYHGVPLVRSFNRRLLRHSLRRVCRKLGFSRPILWSFLPTTADLVGTLDEKLVVYGCVDDYSEFDGADKALIRDLETRLVRSADAVIVSSGPLLESRKKVNPDTYLVEHGVEVEHFRRACDPSTQVAPALAELSGPVIGFFGLIAEWIDTGIIRYLARHRPDWSVVLVGKQTVDTTELRRLPNVHFTGQVPYEQLPSYCRGFDLAIVPFVINELTCAANPLKIKEYLAAGLPVVSTDLPEAGRVAARTGFLRIATGYEHFLEQIDRFLREGVSGPDMRISRDMDRESWDGKVAEMSRIVARTLERTVADAASGRQRFRPTLVPADGTTDGRAP